MAEVDAKAQALVAKACGWVASNPDTWAKLRRICYRLMLEGHVIQRDNVYTLACQNGMTVSEAASSSATTTCGAYCPATWCCSVPPCWPP